MSRTFVSELARRLDAATAMLAPRLLPAGRRDGHYWRAGDITGAAGRSLHLHLGGERCGKWKDMATGDSGDILNLIQQQQGCGIIEAARIGAEMLNDPAFDLEAKCQPIQPARKPPVDMVAAARAIWSQSVPLAGTPGAAYLLARGIDASVFEACEDLRFVSALRARDGNKTFRLPALVAAIRDEPGTITGVHRTFLSAVRPQKAGISNPKQALGQLSGSGVMLASSSRVGCLVVAEGIETALSVKTAYPRAVVMAALTAPHLQLLDVPAGFTRVAIATDPDVAGLRAAAMLSNRLMAGGRSVRIICPAPSQGDFNDILQAGGVNAVKVVVKAQMKSTS